MEQLTCLLIHACILPMSAVAAKTVHSILVTDGAKKSQRLAAVATKHVLHTRKSGQGAHLDDFAVRLAGEEGAQHGEEGFEGLAGPHQDDELDVLAEGAREAAVG